MGKHADGCQCGRCSSAPEGRGEAYPPYCVNCHQVLTTWQGRRVLWGWSGRGMTAQAAAWCPSPSAPGHQHMAGTPGERVYRRGEVTGWRFTRGADGQLSQPEVLVAYPGVQPHCKFCAYGLEWKHDGWWAEAKGDGHLYCERNPDASRAVHVPVGPSCTMGPGCDCPFHDDAPWPDPPRKLRAVHTDGPAGDPPPPKLVAAPPKAQRTPMDELYASTTGRTLPEDSYMSWGEEWVKTGIPYARERMVSHVSLANPAEGFRWNDPGVTYIPAQPGTPGEVEPDKAAALPASPMSDPDLRRQTRMFLLGVSLFILGVTTHFPPLMAMAVIFWTFQVASGPGSVRRIRDRKDKAKAVEGKHAKPKSG